VTEGRVNRVDRAKPSKSPFSLKELNEGPRRSFIFKKTCGKGTSGGKQKALCPGRRRGQMEKLVRPSEMSSRSLKEEVKGENSRQKEGSENKCPRGGPPHWGEEKKKKIRNHLTKNPPYKRGG